MRQSKGAMQRETKAAALKYTEADMQAAIRQAKIDTLREIDRRYTKELGETINEKSDGDLNEYAREVYERTGIGFDALEDE